MLEEVLAAPEMSSSSMEVSSALCEWFLLPCPLLLLLLPRRLLGVKLDTEEDDEEEMEEEPAPT